jgi:hydroxymethylglutaryl-CoA synthase
MKIGIEKARVYPTSMALDMRLLCEARGQDPKHIRDVMMIDERGVNPPWEDPVTMAVNAALPMLSERDKEDLELLICCSESGVDQEKPLSTWVHRYCGIQPRCRNFELKHACYSGTGALQLASAWLASGIASPRAKALIVTTDQSRMHFGKPYELVMGAGACALLVSREPRLFELELGTSVVYTNEVSDLTRPTLVVEQGNSETSLLSYMDALDSCIGGFVARDRASYDHFAKNIFHIPFGGMTVRATRAALRHFGEFTRKEADAIWEKKTKASLAYVRRMGGTYASSTFIGLLAMIDGSPELHAGDRIGMFSYGSGCCAEFYTGLVGEEARAVAGEANVKALLDQRRSISVREYEEAERERTLYVENGNFQPSTNGFGDLYDSAYRGKSRLVYRGMHDFYRAYGWS